MDKDEQGQGSQGHFLGIKTPLERAQIAILPISYDLTTTYGKGTDKGPSALIEASRNLEVYDIETDSEVYKRGIATLETLSFYSTEKMLQEVENKTLSLLDEGKFVVGLGGEHSVSYPLIRAHAKKHPDLTVIQFDAHADLQEAYEGNKWSHACVMARVKELGVPVVSVGVRSLSPSERGKVVAFTEKELLPGPVYISFDVDAFDSSLMPSTGTPEPGGLFWDQAMRILREIAEKNDIVGFDVVELAPIKDFHAPDFAAAKLVYKILSYKYKYEHKNIH